MPKTDIWMPVYIGDYLADTIGLSKSEHGSYLLAMMAYWRKGGPLTDKEIRSILGDDAETILEFFYQENGLWNHKRINAEIDAATLKKQTAQKNGINGGNPNFKKGRANPYYQSKDNPEHNPIDNQEDKQTDKQKINSSPSPSPSSSKSESQNNIIMPNREKKSPKKTSEDFLAELRANPAYSHVDFDRELSRIDAWLSIPKNQHRKKTPTFILNWVNKIEKPLPNGKPTQDRTGMERFERVLISGGGNE